MDDIHYPNPRCLYNKRTLLVIAWTDIGEDNKETHDSSKDAGSSQKPVQPRRRVRGPVVYGLSRFHCAGDHDVNNVIDQHAGDRRKATAGPQAVNEGGASVKRIRQKRPANVTSGA
jgi:hypothetical protein